MTTNYHIPISSMQKEMGMFSVKSLKSRSFIIFRYNYHISRSKCSANHKIVIHRQIKPFSNYIPEESIPPPIYKKKRFPIANQ